MSITRRPQPWLFQLGPVRFYLEQSSRLSLAFGYSFFFFQAEDRIRDWSVTGVQTCALPICSLTLTNGGPPTVIQLGDIGPGALDPTTPVQFPDTSLFTSAIFHATLSQTTFLLDGGKTFTDRKIVV